jgi:hypothetical protein
MTSSSIKQIRKTVLRNKNKTKINTEIIFDKIKNPSRCRKQLGSIETSFRWSRGQIERRKQHLSPQPLPPKYTE